MAGGWRGYARGNDPPGGVRVSAQLGRFALVPILLFEITEAHASAPRSRLRRRLRVLSPLGTAMESANTSTCALRSASHAALASLPRCLKRARAESCSARG